eukprot:26869-Pelagococcus_subviridis.AAC.9
MPAAAPATARYTLFTSCVPAECAHAASADDGDDDFDVDFDDNAAPAAPAESATATPRYASNAAKLIALYGHTRIRLITFPRQNPFNPSA